MPFGGSMAESAMLQDKATAPNVPTPQIGGRLPRDGELGIGALYRSNAALHSSTVLLALMIPR